MFRVFFIYLLFHLAGLLFFSSYFFVVRFVNLFLILFISTIYLHINEIPIAKNILFRLKTITRALLF